MPQNRDSAPTNDPDAFADSTASADRDIAFKQVLDRLAASAAAHRQDDLPDAPDDDDDAGPIPDVVIRRLPLYLRTLRELTAHDILAINSEDFANLLGISAAQLRRDLSYFGRFGRQGKGYGVTRLSSVIGSILKLDQTWPMVLCGMGKLGHAIANYRGFERTAFEITGLFDSDPARIGERIRHLEIRPMDELVQTMHAAGIQIGIIAVPRLEAQTTADLLVEGGVQAILNYAPVILRVPQNVVVREIDPVAALQSMTYYLDQDRRPS